MFIYFILFHALSSFELNYFKLFFSFFENIAIWDDDVVT